MVPSVVVFVSSLLSTLNPPLHRPLFGLCRRLLPSAFTASPAKGVKDNSGLRYSEKCDVVSFGG